MLPYVRLIIVYFIFRMFFFLSTRPGRRPGGARCGGAVCARVSSYELFVQKCSCPLCELSPWDVNYVTGVHGDRALEWIPSPSTNRYHPRGLQLHAPDGSACEQLPSRGSSTHTHFGVRWVRARESPPRKMSSSTS